MLPASAPNLGCAATGHVQPPALETAAGRAERTPTLPMSPVLGEGGNRPRRKPRPSGEAPPPDSARRRRSHCTCFFFFFPLEVLLFQDPRSFCKKDYSRTYLPNGLIILSRESGAGRPGDSHHPHKTLPAASHLALPRGHLQTRLQSWSQDRRRSRPPARRASQPRWTPPLLGWGQARPPPTQAAPSTSGCTSSDHQAWWTLPRGRLAPSRLSPPILAWAAWMAGRVSPFPLWPARPHPNSVRSWVLF